MVKATGGHFLDAVGHLSHASENPSPYLHGKDIARLTTSKPTAGLSDRFLHTRCRKMPQNYPHDSAKSLIYFSAKASTHSTF